MAAFVIYMATEIVASGLGVGRPKPQSHKASYRADARAKTWEEKVASIARMRRAAAERKRHSAWLLPTCRLYNHGLPLAGKNVPTLFD